MIRAAIFDMDGLLFDTERLCCDAWRAVSAQAGYAMSDELFMSCVGRNNQDTRAIVLGEMGDTFPYDDFRDKARDWMVSRMDDQGPPEKPGVRELFEYFKNKGIPLALATSTSKKSATWMIERAGLTEYFSAMAFGSEVSRGKPFPDIFLLAFNRLLDSGALDKNAVPAECAVFEDSPAGLQAARDAGMRSFFVPDMVTPPEALLGGVWKTLPSLLFARDDSLYV
jgi:HAD superfamily hydrolase (TIGR01509 family)